jgi:WD40-like Beta Propeller Repeat
MEKRFSIRLTWSGTAILLAAAFLVLSAHAQRFSDWSAPVNLGSVINSASNDQQPGISPDNLSLYFASDRPGGVGNNAAGNFDLWVSHRASVDAPWGEPQNLGSTINTSYVEFAPAFGDDGHLLFFGSTRPNPCEGTRDIWVSFRKDKTDDFGWEPPVDLGCVVNSSGIFTDGPTYFEDDDTGVITLFFTALDRPGGLGQSDIWASTQNPDGSFNTPVDVEALNSISFDNRTAIRRDGLEIFLSSNRLGSIFNSLGMPSLDIWVSTRASTSDPWGTPVDLAAVDTAFNDGAPALSRDGTQLYFFSNRTGGSGQNDLYVATRTKLRD